MPSNHHLGTRFSISTPIYQQAHFLATAMESLRCQSMPFELAVLDATPDDSAQKVLQDYQDLITYQYHHADAGQTAAIQEGWDNTKGDIVAWLNADDYYFPDTLAKVAAVFAAHPDVDVVYGHGVFVEPENKFQMYFPTIEKNPALLIKNCIICQPSCFVRRNAMERVGGLNPALYYTMDWDLWIRLYRAGCKFYFLDDMLSTVRIYAETKTASGAKKRQREIDGLLKQHGVNWLTRQLFKLGFIYHDLAKNKKTVIDYINYYVLALLYRLRRRYQQHAGTVINGIERRSNQVHESCEVLLPWYNPLRAHEITIITDGPAPKLFFNEYEIALTAEGTQEVIFAEQQHLGYVYRGILNEPRKNLLQFTLKTKKVPWRLWSLSVK